MKADEIKERAQTDRAKLEEEIARLPRYQMGLPDGTKQVVAYDKKEKLAFVLKTDDLSWTGTFATDVNIDSDDGGTPESAGKEKKETPGARSGALYRLRDKLQRSGNTDDASDSPGAGMSPEKKRKLLGGAIIGAVVIGILLWLLLTSGLLSSKKDPGQTVEPAASGEYQDINALAAAEQYNVLVVNRNMYEGERFGAEDLTSCVISKSEFAACGGAYTLECKDAVVGMECTRFLPFGSIIQFDACSYTTLYSRSPWDRRYEGQAYLDVPADLALNKIGDFLPGDMVELVFSVDSTKSTKEAQEKTETDGMEHSSSVSASTTTDVFRFSSIRLVDILDAEENSIYKQISRFYSVPAGFIPGVLRQEYDAGNFYTVIPKYLRFIVTEEQKKEIGTLDRDAVSWTINFQERGENKFVPDYEELTKYIVARLLDRQTEIREEEAVKADG